MPLSALLQNTLKIFFKSVALSTVLSIKVSKIASELLHNIEKENYA
jgi:hypothetical protein